MTHDDWFDQDGLFIGYIPGVIWRPVIWAMEHQGDYRDLEHVRQCVLNTGFCVDVDKAIKHLRAISSWSLEELHSWNNDLLTMEIFVKVCWAISDGEPFTLYTNNQSK